MKLENKYSTVSQSQRLKELGIIQGKSERYWYTGDTGNNIDHLNITGSNYKGDDMCYSAFDVAELGAMLPVGHPRIFKQYDCYEFTMKTSDWQDWQKALTEAQARAAMLIYLLENKLITPESVNERLQNS